MTPTGSSDAIVDFKNTVFINLVHSLTIKNLVLFDLNPISIDITRYWLSTTSSAHVAACVVAIEEDGHLELFSCVADLINPYCVIGSYVVAAVLECACDGWVAGSVV